MGGRRGLGCRQGREGGTAALDAGRRRDAILAGKREIEAGIGAITAATLRERQTFFV